MPRLWLAGLAAAALVAVAAFWPAGDGPAPSIEAAAEDVVASGVPGVLVRLREGERVTELARDEASPGIRFRVGSVTKTFVAALALRLVDLGVLGLVVAGRRRERVPAHARAGEQAAAPPRTRLLRLRGARFVLLTTIGERRMFVRTSFGNVE